MRILELFGGIGGCAVACAPQPSVGAMDISQTAAEVYAANFSAPYQVQEIATVSTDALARIEADMWWMSPPCQPFTRRGRQADVADPRCAGLLRLLRAVPDIRPDFIALENVIGFERSTAYAELQQVLARTNYQVSTAHLCSSQFGIPNQRPRFFLVASRQGQPSIAPVPAPPQTQTLSTFLEDQINDDRRDDVVVPREEIANYAHAINLVSPQETRTCCFTSAYGHSLVRSGSYLSTNDGVRRFTPREIARLLGFPDQFVLPDSLTTRQLWKLLGNSLSIPCVRHVLDAVRTVKNAIDTRISSG